MTMDHVVKLNGKMFTILSTDKKANWKVSCPDGNICHINFKDGKIMHRDCDGKIQCEPILGD